MSTTLLKPEADIVWHGKDVTMADVLEAVDSIRKKFAREEAGDGELPRPRNCVMTLVAVTSTDAEERRAQRVCRFIGALHPVQAVVVRERPDVHSGRIEGWISTDVLRPEMACAVQCELIRLHVHGAAGSHLAELLDPLLISGVPTYLWWTGTPPFGKRDLEDALRIADALVVDSARFDAPYHSFRGLHHLTNSAHKSLAVGDFQWTRLSPWREAIAQFFAPLERRDFLGGISEVGIDYEGEGRGNRIAAALVTGWMASALGWKLKRAAAGPGGVVAAYYNVEPSSRIVEVQFRSVRKEHLASGEVGAIRIAGVSQGTTFRLAVQRDPERARHQSDESYRALHPTGGEDDAGLELAERRAEWHRDVLHENWDGLHHTATGDPPDESRPKAPMVFSHERRGPDTAEVLLTMIEIGEGRTLRHVQRLEPEDDAALMLDLLASGAEDQVFMRSLSAAADLLHSV